MAQRECEAVRNGYSKQSASRIHFGEREGFKGARRSAPFFNDAMRGPERDRTTRAPVQRA